MSKNLTTETIVYYVENDVCPAEWAWESAIDSAVGYYGERDAADGARFLEKLKPGRTWSAAEYLGLMNNHFTGRWQSAAESGRIRAAEAHAEEVDGLDLADERVARSAARFAARMASDEAAQAFLREKGTIPYVAGDGTVLTFDGIFNGVVTPEEPV